MYLIEQNSQTPLYVQLYNQLKKDISNNYKTNEKLPSIRKIASLYNLSKNTVELSYNQLVLEGYIESYPKSGYVATDTTSYKEVISNKIDVLHVKEKENYIHDFYPARLTKDSFPLKLWKRLLSRAIDETIDFGAYPDGQGEIGLRNEISNYIIQSRGVKCTASQIVITNGFADSMGILAKIISNNYGTLAMESPGYHIAKKVFSSYNYKIKNIGVDKNGINLSELKNSQAKLVYTTPSHQYPTGVAMPISARLNLLKWAKQNNALIIEDDYDSELIYENRPIPSLQGLDNFDRVVYLGTFSKALSPSLRVGYMVLPNHLIGNYIDSFDIHFSKVSLMLQKTLELFIKEGYWDKHIRKIRTINRKKHNIMKIELEEKIGKSMKIVSQGAGLAILICPKVKFDWDKLRHLAKITKIKLYFAEDTSGANYKAIRMGFGGFSEEKIVNAIEDFSKLWKKCI